MFILITGRQIRLETETDPASRYVKFLSTDMGKCSQHVTLLIVHLEVFEFSAILCSLLSCKRTQYSGAFDWCWPVRPWRHDRTLLKALDRKISSEIWLSSGRIGKHYKRISDWINTFHRMNYFWLCTKQWNLRRQAIQWSNQTVVLLFKLRKNVREWKLCAPTFLVQLCWGKLRQMARTITSSRFPQKVTENISIHD